MSTQTPAEESNGAQQGQKQVKMQKNSSSASNEALAHTLHGDSAARRRGITELLFFASVGDLKRCRTIVDLWDLKVDDPMCSDYDRRTPLHLAARDASFAVAEWLLKAGADKNAVDRFQRTPLEEAVRNNHVEMVDLLTRKDARVWENGCLVPLEQSSLAQPGLSRALARESMHDVWEINPWDLTLHEKLGEGDFGVVHRASFFGTDVAVKVLKSADSITLGDFRSELAVLRQVHHPNAVQFLGACTRDKPYMIVTELMSGGSLLDAFLRNECKLSLRRALELARDAACGLNYLHQRRPNPIIHRDLKPGNFMVAGSPYCSKSDLVHRSGVLKIADFGLSKTLPKPHPEPGDSLSEYKMTGETGTYRYMAPEVYRHEPYSTKVDVYAFAMMCYELFEGRPPCGGCDGAQVAREAALSGRRPVIVEMDSPKDPVRRSIKELMERMWAGDPDERPSFKEVTHQLTALLSKVPSSGSAQAPCCSVQ
uniref:Protein kinase domain-containing protein n=2 Tax=Tetraselmis sp. GSL018 TaxID=582737 RepID=A0A061RQQ6_9CHLO